MDPRKQQILDKWLQERAKNKSRQRRKKELPEDEGVTINSLMDAVTIILIFLLMNFGADALQVSSSENLQLPRSTTSMNPKSRSTTLTVAADAILVDDKNVLKVKDGKPDIADPDAPTISTLKDHLDELMEIKQKEVELGMKKELADLITVIVHSESPYELVYKVLVTAGSAKFTKFKFAVVKGGQLKQQI